MTQFGVMEIFTTIDIDSKWIHTHYYTSNTLTSLTSFGLLRLKKLES